MSSAPHLRLIWPPPLRHFTLPARTFAFIGAPGVGKTTVLAAVAAELLWRGEHVVLIDAAGGGDRSLSRWVEAAAPGVFRDAELLQARAADVPHSVARAAARGGTVLVDVGSDALADETAAICRAVRLSVIVRWRDQEARAPGLDLAAIRDLRGRGCARVLFNGLRVGDPLRRWRMGCAEQFVGSFGSPVRERPALRFGLELGRPPAFRGRGALVARREIAAVVDDFDKHFEHIAFWRDFDAAYRPGRSG